MISYPAERSEVGSPKLPAVLGDFAPSCDASPSRSTATRMTYACRRVLPALGADVAARLARESRALRSPASPGQGGRAGAGRGCTVVPRAIRAAILAACSF